MRGSGKTVRQPPYQLAGKVLIEEQLHAGI
jgi:hypothetical protein